MRRDPERIELYDKLFIMNYGGEWIEYFEEHGIQATRSVQDIELIKTLDTEKNRIIREMKLERLCK